MADNINVTISEATPIQVTIADATPIRVSIQAIGGGISNIAAADDTDITNPQTNDLLAYNASTGKFENKDVLNYKSDTDEFEINQI